MVMIPGNKTEKSATKIIEDIKKDLESRGAEVFFEDSWGKRQMTYPINHIDEAYYHYYHMKLEGAAIDTLKKDYNINEDILRYVVVSLPADYQEKDGQHLVEIVEDIVNFGEEKAKRTTSQPIPNPEKAKEKANDKKKDAVDAKIENILKS